MSINRSQKTLSISVLILTVLAVTSCSSVHKQPGMSIKDEIGREVVIPSTIARIIALTPANTEILFALGLGDKIVGVTDFCDYPLQAKQKEKIGGYQNTNLEKVLSLKPDLILASKDGNDKRTIEKFDQLGFSVYTVYPQTLDDVFKTVFNIGMITNTKVQAESLIAQLKARIQNIQKISTAVTIKPRILCIIGENPLFAVGPGSFPDDLIRLAGGTNITHDGTTRYPQYSMEKVLQMNPDIIIKTTMVGVSDTTGAFKEWAKWKSLNAIKNNRCYLINPDLILRPGPRLVEGLEALSVIVRKYKAGLN